MSECGSPILMEPSMRDSTIKKPNLWLWGAAGLALFYGLHTLHTILLPFLTGLLVAYAMNPAVTRLEKWGLPRGLGTSLVIVSFFLSIGLLLCIAIPLIHSELLRLAFHLPQYGDRIRAALQPFLDEASAYINPGDLQLLRKMGSTYMVDIITWCIRLFATALTSGLAIANLLSLIVLTPIVAFYCLRDWHLIMATVSSWVPRPYEEITHHLFAQVNETIGQFVRGQTIVCLLMGLYYSLFLTLAQLDFSLTVGPAIGVITFIPYVGAFLGFMVSMGIAFSQFPDWFSIQTIVVIFILGQLLEGYLFIPYFVGDRIGLHPVWVIFALLAGGVLYGFFGMLFALPIAAALGVLIRYGLTLYTKSPYYLGSHQKRSHAAASSAP